MHKSILTTSLLLAISGSVAAEVIRPTGFQQGQIRWQEQGNRTDDFESGSLNPSKWENAPASLNVGAWTFAQPNAYVSNGRLIIETTQETHTRSFQDSCWDGVAGGSSKTVQRELYYKSGAVRSSVEGVYGFYEAKIKGVDIFPGLSPAFWLYSDGHPFPDRNEPGQYVDYSEIDIVELQQADWRSPTDFDDQFDMDHNLHARVEENGQIVWKRPKPNPEAQLLHYEAPFDPGLDFHTYAVENRPDKITWYVDGVEIGSKPNKWWHRPMHLIFSQGLRRHLIKYNSACQRADPNPDNVISQGFPEKARMQVEYVKTWKALPSVWIANPGQYQSTNYPAGGDLRVTVSYHGGSDDYVDSGNYNGVTLNLIEKNANGLVRVVKSVNDPSTTNDDKKYAGDAVMTIDLSGVTPTADLPNGHYYALAPVFKSSNGSTIYAQSAVANINITGSNNGGGNVAVTGVSLSPSSLSLAVNATKQLSATVSPYNASNPSVYYYSDDSAIASVNDSGLVTGKQAGSTQITVTTNDGTFTDTSLVTVTSDSNSGGDPGSCDGSWVAVSSVELSAPKTTLSPGETVSLTANVLPVCASNKNVTFSSSNTSAAIVNSSGVVTARNVGTTIITVKTKNLGKTDTVTITVK
ncbi:Ig-like domain-containing protein [Neiella sp. HB171785]|uniref:Ig-like domain-containing protein n=1 Tax=Neiella litorisoli TaxID=2771431 RepID=A0A8J6UPH0_9GAMM|nr:Ig-like domain-containing protein [Neiella litorisoli]MBD1388352.1 Ig-like domain-containing protein [Neiella litorisoli]